MTRRVIHSPGLKLLPIFGKSFLIHTRRFSIISSFKTNPTFLFLDIRGHVLSEDAYYRTLTKDKILISKRVLSIFVNNTLARIYERDKNVIFLPHI
jgi:hypothetical protein